METKVDQIKSALQTLKDSPVLSIYLNTHPASDDWKIRLKNGLKKMEEYVAVSEPQQEKLFKKVSHAVDKKIKDHQTSFGKSIICFASDSDLYIYFLQIPVDNDFQWRNGAATNQLNQLISTYPKSGVILLQHGQITLISTELGELIGETHFTFDIENEDWKQYKGLAFNQREASSVNHQDKVEKRIKENFSRWYKKIIPQIEQYAKRYNWQEIHLAGPSELLSDIQKRLNRRVTSETNRNFSNESPADILEKIILNY